MAYEPATARDRKLYARLLRLYPKPFRKRFSEGMAQTFNDLCQEREEAGDGLVVFEFQTFFETGTGIVKERMTYTNMQITNVLRVALATAFILLLPLLAMQFTDEVVWDLADFAAAGALLFGAGVTYEMVAKKAGNIAHQVAIGLAVAAGLILVWMNLAVGLLGSEGNPANVMYIGVLAVGISGAIIARFQPHGMGRALFATALAQAVVPLIALTIWKPQVISAEELLGILGVNAFFVALFIGSALLFRRAGAQLLTHDG